MNRKRTKKVFTDYNEYQDRPFGLKWGTAFAMDELMKSIHLNEYEALKEPPRWPLMTRQEIDICLSEAFFYQQPLMIQLNLVDPFGRMLEHLEGFFFGEAYEDYFVFNDQKILWEDVRHVKIKEQQKWFQLAETAPEKIKAPLKNEELYLIQDQFYQPFYDPENAKDLPH